MNEYPMYVFHKDGRQQLVETPEAHIALGYGWGEHPDGPFWEHGEFDDMKQAVPETMVDAPKMVGTAATVLAAVNETDGTPVEIASRINVPTAEVTKILEALATLGQLKKARFGRYTKLAAPEEPEAEPLPTSPSTPPRVQRPDAVRGDRPATAAEERVMTPGMDKPEIPRGGRE